MTATCISTIRKIGLTLGLALSLSTVATSSSFAYSARARQMCMDDAFRLCSSEIPNIGRIVTCMRRNKASLSQGCRAVMDQEDTAAAKTKPLQAAPVEQKPTTASRVEQAVPTETKPVETAPVEQKSTTASRVDKAAATETKPVQAAPVEQKSTSVSPVEKPAATETKPIQAAPVEQKSTSVSPVEEPAATDTKPIQAAPAEQPPTSATPVEVRPFKAKSAARSKPAKLAQRKRRQQQLTIEQHIHREFRNSERTIGFALPIPLVFLFYW